MRIKRSLPPVLYWITVILLIFNGLLNNKKQEQSSIPITPTIIKQEIKRSEPVRVIRVIDGDTIVIEGEKTIRYIGIDTPETKHPTKGVECYGQEASSANEKLVKGKYVSMQKDISETDRYGRLLRYVWVWDNPEASGAALFINDYLVREGYAFASTYPPDVAYADQFARAQQEARENKKGLWNSCGE